MSGFEAWGGRKNIRRAGFKARVSRVAAARRWNSLRILGVLVNRGGPVLGDAFSRLDGFGIECSKSSPFYYKTGHSMTTSAPAPGNRWDLNPQRGPCDKTLGSLLFGGIFNNG